MIWVIWIMCNATAENDILKSHHKNTPIFLNLQKFSTNSVCISIKIKRFLTRQAVAQHNKLIQQRFLFLPLKYPNVFFFFFKFCTVQFDICTVHSPTNALFYFKKHIKIYIKIYINIAPTCFGLRPSSGSLHWTWLKLYLCSNFRWNYVVIYYVVVWQHASTQPHNK